MVWFTYLYLSQRFVLLDVCPVQGGQRFKASVSAAPEICIEDARPDRALTQLVSYLRGAPSDERSSRDGQLQATP